jgi:hypothetical protein
MLEAAMALYDRWKAIRGYPLSGTPTERDRLLPQAKHYEPSANCVVQVLSRKPAH